MAVEKDERIAADEHVDMPLSASEQMRAARAASGLSLADIAAQTRVPLRHLEALEEGRYGDLPGVTYCAGFARAYAREVGLDDAALVAQLRNDLEDMGDLSRERYEMDEPIGSNSVPPRYLAWTAAALAVILIGGYTVWRMQLMIAPTDEQILNQPPPETRITTANTPPAQSSPAPAPAGPVVLTAVDDVWLRIYDGDGKRLFEKAMAKGETYTVPPDANNPMILTGRADALSVTVGGQAVPPLGTAERTIADVPISAAALLARAPAETGDSNSASGNASVAPASSSTSQSAVPGR